MFVSNFLSKFNFYDIEFQRFQRDAYVLIEGSLDASIQHLRTATESRLAEIDAGIEKATNQGYQQYLVDEHDVVSATNSDQEQFLRNMALVALASRLTHSLNSMARSAESFSKRKKRYTKKKRMSEFGLLWAEYQARFGIDFSREHKD